MGHPVRRAYLRAPPNGATRATRPIPGLSVLSFSGERDVAEQMASIRSFLTHVGEPAAWTIVSDGTHSRRSRALLAHVHPRVTVRELAHALRPGLPAEVMRYAAREPMGKKLALELSLGVREPTLYVDADVLFFPGAGELVDLVTGADRRPRYLADCGTYLDERLLDANELANPVNGGVFLLWRPLDWRAALARLPALDGRHRYHSEQTLLHLAMHTSGARPLAPDRYVLSRRDEHDGVDAYAREDMVLRHYTTPVRPKFWSAVQRFGI
jgi:hypothetical protein